MRAGGERYIAENQFKTANRLNNNRIAVDRRYVSLCVYVRRLDVSVCACVTSENCWFVYVVKDCMLELHEDSY